MASAIVERRLTAPELVTKKLSLDEYAVAVIDLIVSPLDNCTKLNR